MKEFVYLYLNDAPTFMLTNLFTIFVVGMIIILYMAIKEERRSKR